MSTAIKLNFINRSADANDSPVVILQRNEAPGFDRTTIAWKVIEHCAPGDNHPFTFSMDTCIAASDSYGNFTPQVPAAPGQQFAVKPSSAGARVEATGPAASEQAIELVYDLTQGALNAWISRDGHWLATVTGITPGQKVLFELKTGIWIGVAPPGVVEGQILDSAIHNDINTQLSLLGIRKANIIMSGGPHGQPYTFHLEEVAYE